MIQRPTELALSIEVVESGASRSAFEILPGDTIRVTPLVADPERFIAPNTLELQWILCPQLFECVDALTRVTQLESCDAPYERGTSCDLGVSGIQTFTWPGLSLADLRLDQGELTTPLDATYAPYIAMIGSSNSGPGPDACITALSNQESLSGCLLMVRQLVAGPWAEIFEWIRRQGIDVDISDELSPYLARPRNHNPLVDQFLVSTQTSETTPTSAAHETTLSVQAGERISVQYLPTEEDFDDYEIAIEGSTAVIEQELMGTWFISTPAENWTPGIGHVQPLSAAEQARAERCIDCTLSFDVPDVDRFNLYFVVQDDLAAEHGGWITFNTSQ